MTHNVPFMRVRTETHQKTRQKDMAFSLSIHSYESQAITRPLPARSMVEILRYYSAGSTQTFEGPRLWCNLRPVLDE